MTRNQLTQLNHEELIDLILALQSEVEALCMKLQKYQKPPTNSSNSSKLYTNSSQSMAWSPDGSKLVIRCPTQTVDQICFIPVHNGQ